MQLPAGNTKVHPWGFIFGSSARSGKYLRKQKIVDEGLAGMGQLSKVARKINQEGVAFPY